MVKLCGSPANTTCMYQRLARDQAPDEPNAQSGAASQAYADLYQHLDGDTEALALLKHLMDCLTNGGTAMDEPESFAGQPLVGGFMERNYQVGRVEPNPPQPGRDRRMSQDSAIRAGRAQAQQYVFAKRFPGAARIRVLG